jgi:RNA polymerase sigma factor (sigma-70 family)
MVPESDADVIGASLVEPAVFGRLFDRHATVLFRYLVRRVGVDDAELLLGDVFRVAFEKRETYDRQRPNARPWLYGIATNLIGRRHRAETRFWRLIAQTGVDDTVEPLIDQVTDRVTAQGMRRELASAVAGLPRGQRDVLLLTAAGGLSAEEIASALGIAKGTVHSRLNRARKKMRNVLGETDPREVVEGVTG